MLRSGEKQEQLNHLASQTFATSVTPTAQRERNFAMLTSFNQELNKVVEGSGLRATNCSVDGQAQRGHAKL